MPPLEPLRIRSARRGSRPCPPLRAGTGLRHTALGWGDQTLQTTPQTADTAGRLPPGICFSMMASGQRSTDPNGAGDQEATGLRSPQTAPPSHFTAGAGTKAAAVGGRPRYLTRKEWLPLATRHSETTCLAGKVVRKACGLSEPVGSDHPASYIVPPTSLGGRKCVQTFPCPKSVLGGVVLYGVVRARGRFPIQSGPQLFANFSADSGRPANGKVRLVNWRPRRPHRPAVSPTPRRALTPWRALLRCFKTAGAPTRLSEAVCYKIIE